MFSDESKKILNNLYLSNKVVIFLELILALLIIAGHLLGVIPYTSTVFVLLFAWISLYVRGKKWKNFGLSKPANWIRTIILSMGAGIIYQMISLFIIEPALSYLTGELPDVSIFSSLKGNIEITLFWIFIAWSLAAFGEELVYRGYFMHRIGDLFTNRKTGEISAVIISSILFGSVHLYQGAPGMISVGLFGLVFASLYYASGRNLWAPILAHGISNTTAFVMIYLGIYPGI